MGSSFTLSSTQLDHQSIKPSFKHSVERSSGHIILIGSIHDSRSSALFVALKRNELNILQFDSLTSLPKINICNSIIILCGNNQQHLFELERIHVWLINQNMGVVVLLKNAETSDQVIKCYMHLGVEEFILPSTDEMLIITKLKSILNYRQIQAQYNLLRQNFEKNQLQIQQEKQVARNIYDQVLASHYLDTSAVKTNVSRNSLCHGYLILVGRTPNDHLHVLLGDFSGHGLSTLVSTSPVVDIFYGMSNKGFSITEIAQETNKKLSKLLPVELFLAASFVAIQPESKSMTVVNCGLPEHFLVNRTRNRIKKIHATNLPLGVDNTVEPVEQRFDLTAQDYLYMPTSALFKAKNAFGEVLATNDIIDTLKSQHQSGFTALSKRISQHLADEQAATEIVFVEIHCDVDTVPWRSQSTEHKHVQPTALPWKTMLEFEAQALKKVNPVPIVINTLMGIQDLKTRQQEIFLIVNELFANALDHGLLELDSSLKQTPEGFAHYYEQKEIRLAALQKGYIRLFFKHVPTPDGGTLKIRVYDSGNGFNQEAITLNLQENSTYCGRGIALLDSICSRLRYNKKGNSVEATFEWTYD